MSLVQLEPGTIFAGDYRVVSLISQGGMGAVYLVEQRSTGAQRALKVMLPQLVSDALYRRRFEQEARIGSRIESDHVVQVIAAGIDRATGTPWLAMELLRGEDLASVVRTRGPLPVAEVATILEQLCHALGAAHRVGIVHRDLKPENVFLSAARRADARSQVKILDFGVAKMVAEAFTSGAFNVGSPVWMSPEQGGRQAIGPGADIWSLGLLAYYLLTGTYYWRAANDDLPLEMLVREIAVDEITPASRRAREFGAAARVPHGFDPWFERCVNRSPEARFATANDAFHMFCTLVRDAAPRTGPRDRTALDLNLARTLSSIPPASPTFDPDEVIVGSRPPSLRPSRPPSWAPPRIEIGRPPIQTETGPGTSHSTAPSPAARRNAGTIVGITAIAVAACFAGLSIAHHLSDTTGAPSAPSAASQTRKGDVVRVTLPTPKRVKIPSGSFVMGSLEGTGPERSRTLIDAFQIDETETPVRDWKACEASGTCPVLFDVAQATSPQCNLLHPDLGDLPMNCVTWSEASTYCAWLGGRLPTEEQWEYAASAGREGRVTPFPWGVSPTARNANGEGDEDGFPFTAPVGRFPRGASEFKVLDMSGNVAEWTASAYAPGAPLSDDVERVTRGGSYESDVRAMRASARVRAVPGLRAPTLGFRCVR